jgi:aspartate/methionine/tyrosine aminotransferase
VASWDTLKMVADLAKRDDLLVISDEIYDFFLYDSAPRSIAEIYPKTLVLNGFSKFAAMTGWRVGYALGPKELIAAMADIQQYSFVCAPSVGQHAALEALDTDPSEFVKAYTQKRDVIYNGLKDRFDVAKPGGAFYVFPGVRKGDGDEFVKKAIERSVLIVPGSVFSERRMHFRLSFAATDQTLERGIKVLNQLADELWGCGK